MVGGFSELPKSDNFEIQMFLISEGYWEENPIWDFFSRNSVGMPDSGSEAWHFIWPQRIRNFPHLVTIGRYSEFRIVDFLFLGISSNACQVHGLIEVKVKVKYFFFSHEVFLPLAQCVQNFLNLLHWRYIICPRSSDPFCIVTYYIKWVTTSWTLSTY